MREKTGKPYLKYQKAVEKINLIEWIKGEIEKQSERIIVVKIDDIVKELGPDFEKNKYGTIYQALHYILFYNGFIISIGTHQGDKVFIIREKSLGDKLAKSYRRMEKRVELEEEKKQKRKEEIKKIEEKTKKIDEKKLVNLEENYQRLLKERDELIIEIQRKKGDLLIEKSKLEEIRKEVDNITKINKILTEKFGDIIYMVEIFQFNWKTLAWKMVKRKSSKNYIYLIELITEYKSKIEERYRIEFTPFYDVQKRIEKEKIFENEKILEKKEEKKEDVDEKERQIECPRCGSKNINTWNTIQIIKTRSGVRKLRYRCIDCNETFGDED